MIDTKKYEGLTNDGKWRGTDADDSVIYYDAERDWYATIALVQRDSDYYGNEDNPDMRLMADAPLLLAEVKRLRSLVDDLYAYIVSDGDISWSTIEDEMNWREEEE
tara:strand:- start:84 stop:401 length:318 start_codon:yes stop_codon:yes gene_type:complete